MHAASQKSCNRQPAANFATDLRLVVGAWVLEAAHVQNVGQSTAGRSLADPWQTFFPDDPGFTDTASAFCCIRLITKHGSLNVPCVVGLGALHTPEVAKSFDRARQARPELSAEGVSQPLEFRSPSPMYMRMVLQRVEPADHAFASQKLSPQEAIWCYSTCTSPARVRKCSQLRRA